ncbi:MAG TPA: thiamine phosphate synthase [Brevundimonas sp.]|uniref:thiamine phosphate synthase n=1 Tax=Brevundimonas sp. TaxID=1871086 RepID=UPI002DEE2EF6|nr:thiamine phosphate synthase [Brevundimonas sp.]
MDGRVPPGEIWRIAVALNRAAAAVDPRAGRLPPLIFMTDPIRTPRPWRTAARLPAGAAVIHRGFGRPEAPDEVARLRDATRTAGVRLLVAADEALALSVGADGLHLPERDLHRADPLRARRPDWLLTGALHAPARSAPRALDAVLVSPVFAAGGASAARPPLGPQGLAAMIAAAGVPAYALGGIGPANARTLADGGAVGIAAVAAVSAAFGH